MSVLEIASFNPEYVLSSRASQPVSITRNHSERNFNLITQLRDDISDTQCGRYRECHARPSSELGCGARLTSIDGERIEAECPAGSPRPYEMCAERVLNAIAEHL